MENFHVQRKLLFLSIFCLVSALATEPTSSPGPSPYQQPVSSPNAEPDDEPESSPTPSSLPPLNHVSFPPSGTDAPSPSESIPPSSSSSDLPDGPEESPDGPDGPEDSPDGADGPEDSPEGPDGEVPSPYLPFPPEPETGPDSEPTQETANANPEVKKICESTDYPSLCINTINPLVRGKIEVSIDVVLEVSIKASNDLAKAALAIARKLANRLGTRPELASVLNDCKVCYDDALYDFQRAMEAYVTRDIGTMNTMLSAVITDVEDCEDEFASLNIPSPIAVFAEKLTNMTSNCLAIVSLVQY